jgi:hypothetical protein
MMPLEFTTDTINAANAGAVGQAMIEQIRDDLVAHSAWELVEEYTPASVMKWYVFKCLASVSGLDVDYYVIFGRTLGSGLLQAFIAEGYNSSTHVASLYPANFGSNGNTNTWTYDSDGRQTNNTFTLGIAPLGSTQPRFCTWTPSGVSTKWWLTIDDDGFSVAFNGAANGWMHFGAYEWLGSIPNDCAIHFVGSDSPSGIFAYHGITRNPAVASSTAGHAATMAEDSPGGSGTPLALGFVGRIDRNDKLVSDERPVAELAVTINSQGLSAGAVNGMENIGWVAGKVKRMRYGINPPAGIAFGDAYAHNGTLWVPAIPTSGRIWDTGVAV